MVSVLHIPKNRIHIAGFFFSFHFFDILESFTVIFAAVNTCESFCKISLKSKLLLHLKTFHRAGSGSGIFTFQRLKMMDITASQCSIPDMSLCCRMTSQIYIKIESHCRIYQFLTDQKFNLAS
ncbi:hypothetical protein XENOCAPTIV_015175 [Xenoophorus captivus]|uniref:Uncharacterized protein n=1 Tax=Xenoophorus captivus TaxID=1517983 RepID=A0ABV0RA59_9TELE